MSRQVQQGIGGILTYVAVGLIVAAQAYQFWIVSTLTTGGLITTTEYGLYQACSVTNIGTVCRFYSWTPEFTGEELTAFVTRVILIGADVLFLVGFVASLVALALSNKNRRQCLLVAGIMNIIGGSLAVIAAIVYIALALSQFLLTSLVGSNFTRTYYFAFCYGFCWVAGVLFIIGGVLQIIASKKDHVEVHPSTMWTTQVQTQRFY